MNREAAFWLCLTVVAFVVAIVLGVAALPDTPADGVEFERIGRQLEVARPAPGIACYRRIGSSALSCVLEAP